MLKADCLTIGDAIRHQADRSPNAAALLSVGGHELSWSDLVTQLDRTRQIVASHGLDENGRVAIVIGSGPLLAAAFLTVSANITCAPLNSTHTAEEFEFYYTSLKVQALITTRGLQGAAHIVAARLGLTVIYLEPVSEAGAFTSIGGVEARKQQGSVGPSDIALMLHTSGTTGRPKLVPLSHQALLHSARNIASELNLSSRDRCLGVMPLFHIHGLVGGLLASLVSGGSSACAPKFDVRVFFDWMKKTRPTWYTAVPTIHHAILAASRDLPELAHSFRFIRSCSASLPPFLLTELERVFRTPVIEAYGMTEAAHQISTNQLESRKVGTVGIPSGVEVQIVDQQNQPLRSEQIGEVVISGPSVFDGYEGNSQANADSFVGNWFRTGDLGFIDAAGYLTLVGRLKEQINRGGEKISPLEIDHIAMECAGVSEAVAFGIPHPTLGEEVGLAVVMGTSTLADRQNLQQRLRMRLGPSKVPRRIFFVENIPKGASGKVQRRNLGEVLEVSECLRLEARADSVDPAPLENEVMNVFRNRLNCPLLSVDENFFDSGGDSLSAVQVLLDLEELTGHALPESLLLEAPTARLLAARLSGSHSLESNPVVEIQRGTQGPSLLFFHGDRTGGGLYTRRLADSLGSEHGLVAIAPHGSHHSEPVPPSVESMAADRLNCLLSVQSSGPFRLGGACVGGLIAFETARLLITAGHVVESVILIDSPLLNARPSVQALMRAAQFVRGSDRPVSNGMAQVLDLAWLWGSKAETLLRTDSSTRWSRIRNSVKLRIVNGRSLQTGSITTEQTQAVTSREQNSAHRALVEASYLRVLRRYVPQPLEVPALYLSAEHRGEPLRHLTPQLTVQLVPGGHFGCLSTHLTTVAGRVRAELSRLNRRCAAGHSSGE